MIRSIRGGDHHEALQEVHPLMMDEITPTQIADLRARLAELGDSL